MKHLINLFTPPTRQEVLKRDLREAELALADFQRQCEHSTAMCAMLADRIDRIKTELK